MTRVLRRRNPEHGGAMLVTMVILASLLAGAAVLVSLQLGANRSTDMTRSGISALYCAEAGLAAARTTVAANYAQWNASLNQTTEPTWLANAFSHDLDGDTIADFQITLKDNDDEQSPLANDPTRDNDLQVFVVSTCIKHAETPKQVSELLLFNGATSCYQSQVGGCGGNGNSN